MWLKQGLVQCPHESRWIQCLLWTLSGLVYKKLLMSFLLLHLSVHSHPKTTPALDRGARQHCTHLYKKLSSTACQQACNSSTPLPPLKCWHVLLLLVCRSWFRAAAWIEGGLSRRVSAIRLSQILIDKLGREGTLRGPSGRQMGEWEVQGAGVGVWSAWGEKRDEEAELWGAGWKGCSVEAVGEIVNQAVPGVGERGEVWEEYSMGLIGMFWYICTPGSWRRRVLPLRTWHRIKLFCVKVVYFRDTSSWWRELEQKCGIFC
jgi:hypothetical protein